jgi:hypothetical protein
MTEVTSKDPMDPTDPLVLIQDVRALDLCMSGCREWIKKHSAEYGFTWDHFVFHGYWASQFEATGDHLILRVTEQARVRCRKAAAAKADSDKRKAALAGRKRRG